METSTSTGPSWEIEFQTRIKAFATAIGASLDVVKKAFAELGVDGNNEQSLTIIDSDEFLPMSDLFEVFVDSGLTKKARLRSGMPHLRGKTHLGETAEAVDDNALVTAIKEMTESNQPLTALSDAKLLDRYDDTETEVSKILRERTHGRKCIVFNKDGSINKDVSLELIRAARRQATPDQYSVNGKVVRTYRAGDFPAIPLEESPFCPGVALVNGYCGESNTNWGAIPHDNRVFARLIVEMEKPSKSELRQIHIDVYNDTHGVVTGKLREKYSEVALVYDERQANDTLPKLKIIPGQRSAKIDTGFCK